MFLIVGLGNPGRKYEHTRHNAGFDAVDAIAKKYRIDISTRKHKCLFGKGIIGQTSVILAKPQTFMNLSGECVAELLHYYKADPETELLVIFDDISLEPGRIRIRKKGSAGGHNGIRNIISLTGTDVFQRIKIGVGEKPAGWDLADYVLSRFDAEDRKSVDEALGRAVEAAEAILRQETDQAMNQFN